MINQLESRLNKEHGEYEEKKKVLETKEDPPNYLAIYRPWLKLGIYLVLHTVQK